VQTDREEPTIIALCMDNLSPKKPYDISLNAKKKANPHIPAISPNCFGRSRALSRKAEAHWAMGTSVTPPRMMASTQIWKALEWISI